MKYNIGDKVWLKENEILENGIYEIEDVYRENILICGNRRFGILKETLDELLIHHLPCEVEKKDNIERLEYESLSEDRKVGINIRVHYFDADILSYASHSGKESGNNTIYTVITHKNKILVDKLNEIIKYINKENK